MIPKRRTGVPVEIRAGQLSYTSQECYYYCSLLGEMNISVLAGFAAQNQQNAQYCILDIHIISH